MQDDAFVISLVDFTRVNCMNPVPMRLHPLYTNLVTKVMHHLGDADESSALSGCMAPPRSVVDVVEACTTLVNTIPEQWASFMTLVSKVVRYTLELNTINKDEVVAIASKGIFETFEIFEKTRTIRTQLSLEIIRSVCTGEGKMTSSDYTNAVQIMLEPLVLEEVSG